MKPILFTILGFILCLIYVHVKLYNVDNNIFNVYKKLHDCLIQLGGGKSRSEINFRKTMRGTKYVNEFERWGISEAN